MTRSIDVWAEAFFGCQQGTAPVASGHGCHSTHSALHSGHWPWDKLHQGGHCGCSGQRGGERDRAFFGSCHKQCGRGRGGAVPGGHLVSAAVWTPATWPRQPGEGQYDAILDVFVEIYVGFFFFFLMFRLFVWCSEFNSCQRMALYNNIRTVCYYHCMQSRLKQLDPDKQVKVNNYGVPVNHLNTAVCTELEATWPWQTGEGK